MTMIATRYTCGACSAGLAGQHEWLDEALFSEHIVQHKLGFCSKCKRWARWAEACPVCGQGFEIQHEAWQELRHQFGELILALQDRVPHEQLKTPVQLEPKLWGSEARGIVKAAMNPLFWANMTTPDLRMAVGLLTAVAGQYGVLTELRPEMGEEVTMTGQDGISWLMWRNAKTGMLSPIRQLEPPRGLAWQADPRPFTPADAQELEYLKNAVAVGKATKPRKRGPAKRR